MKKTTLGQARGPWIGVMCFSCRLFSLSFGDEIGPTMSLRTSATWLFRGRAGQSGTRTRVGGEGQEQTWMDGELGQPGRRRAKSSSSGEQSGAVIERVRGGGRGW